MSGKLPSNPPAKIQRIYELVSVTPPLLLCAQEQQNRRFFLVCFNKQKQEPEQKVP
jgi:hypothetical protein